MKPAIRVIERIGRNLRHEIIPKWHAIYFGPGSDAYSFFCTLPEQDPRLGEITLCLEAHGVRRMPREWDYELEGSSSGYYRTIRLHGFQSTEFAGAEYLWLQEMDSGEWDADAEGDRHPDGLLPIVSNTIPKRGKLMSCGPDVFLVSEAFRHDLEAEKFVGIGFHPTKQLKEKTVKGEYQYVPFDPPSDRVVWELRPTLELPPMHAEVVRTFDGKPVASGVKQPTSFSNAGFDDVQLVYARSALTRTGRFDVAHTFEWRFGRENDPAYPIIVSQRFYQFCKTKKLPARFVPVKVVEGE